MSAPPLVWERIETTTRDNESRITKSGGMADYIHSGALERAPVPGGWLVRLVAGGVSGAKAAGLTFVPDPNHSWKVKIKS